MALPVPTYRAFGTFRFLLALAVVVSHTLEFSFPEGHFLRRLGIGNVAVMGFFILSGFIITEALATYYRGRPFAFMSNRLVRIVPPYWAALTVSIAIHAALASHGTVRTPDPLPPGVFAPGSILENALAIFPRPGILTVPLDHPFYGFVRFYWAVYIELIFYVVAFVVALLRPRRATVIAAGAGALLLHIANEYVRPAELGFAFAPYFVIGVCLYCWITDRDRIALVGIVSCYVLIFLHFTRYVQGKVPLSIEWAAKLLEPPSAVATLFMMAVPLTIWWLARAKPILIDASLGNLSYPIYLNHWTMIVVFHTLMSVDGFAVQVSAIAASVALSWFLMHAVETPMKPLRDWLRGQPLGTDHRRQPTPVWC